MRQRGFAVPEENHSNYTFTALTLVPRLLNEAIYLSDIPALAPMAGTARRGRVALLNAVRDAVLFVQLHELGYETFGTGGRLGTRDPARRGGAAPSTMARSVTSSAT